MKNMEICLLIFLLVEYRWLKWNQLSYHILMKNMEICLLIFLLVEYRWLKWNQLSYPHIGMLVSIAANDLEGLKLQIR